MFEGVKVVVGLISFIMVYRTITGNCNKYLAFAICAIWLRFFLSAFHTITYPSLVAGFSINALSSISVAGLGLFFLPFTVFTLKKLFPFYLFFAVIAVSGFVNMKIPGAINVLVKWWNTQLKDVSIVPIFFSPPMGLCYLKSQANTKTPTPQILPKLHLKI